VPQRKSLLTLCFLPELDRSARGSVLSRACLCPASPGNWELQGQSNYWGWWLKGSSGTEWSEKGMLL
jgi:hypothetical protein